MSTPTYSSQALIMVNGIPTVTNIAGGGGAPLILASSIVNTIDSGTTSNVFSTTSNSPAFTFIPTISGTYKVYASIPIYGTETSSTWQGIARIYNTSGSATLQYESQASVEFAQTAVENNRCSVYIQSVYTLTAGTQYVFDIQTASLNGQTVNVDASASPFYMFAEMTVPFSGGGASVYFASSQVTTQSSGITATTFTTFSNSPALTFTPSVTGTYKVYSSAGIFNSNASTSSAYIRVYNTSGGATLLNESQGGLYEGVTGGIVANIYTQSVYALTAGTQYQFDLQGKVSGGTGVYLDGEDAGAFYMFAELMASVPPFQPTGSYAQAYLTQAATWSTTSNSYATPTVSGTPVLTVRQNSGITLTNDGSTPSITFVPANPSAAYLITATICVSDSNAAGSTLGSRLYDGTQVIGQGPDWYDTIAGENTGITLGPWIYVPSTSSPVTVAVQLSTSAGTVTLGYGANGNPVEWSIVRIA